MNANVKYTFSKINNLALAPEDFLRQCTRDYAREIDKAVLTVLNEKNKNIIALAGPSSSGKTTTAAMLSKSIGAHGAKAYIVSLDDFYYSHSENKYPLDENGAPDYESVDALDVERIHRCFAELNGSGESALPVFDFMKGERIDGARKIRLNDNDVIIVEGLHALNPVITSNLGEDNVFRMYVSVSSRVYENDESVLLSKRNLRLIRRTVRDNSFRATSPERTFEIWQSVMRGEDKYLFPFEKFADIKLNSFHPCEPCVLAGQAIPLLATVKGEFEKDARLLLEKLSLFRKTDKSLLPEESLLREFTG